MEFPHLEKFFQGLTDITDKIASMNSHFDSDPESDIAEMLDFHKVLLAVKWEESEKEYFDLFSSHFTFHLKIVEEIISEAREILNAANRENVKRLVTYVRESEEWFQQLKKKRKTSFMATVN